MKKSYERLAIIVLVLLFLGAVIRMVLPLFMEDYGYQYYPHMFGGTGFPMGVIGMGLFWILVIVGIVYWVSRQNGSSSSSFDLNLLKKRLANGEITLEEYENIKKKINEV